MPAELPSTKQIFTETIRLVSMPCRSLYVQQMKMSVVLEVHV